MPKLSIIVPIYKVDNYLSQCLNSIINQTCKDLEIILIDEGDMDRCREIIDDYQAHDSRIIALHDKHGGYGNSVNAGIEIATGDYIGFVESDDFIEPEMFELLYNKAIETGADVVKSEFYYYSDDNGSERVPKLVKIISKSVPIDRYFSPKLYPEMFTSHPSIWAGIYKTDWLQNSGIRFLPKGAYLDIKFRFDIMMSTDKVAWIDKPLYHWRLSNPTSTNASWNYAAGIERWSYIHEYFEDKEELWSRMAPIFIPEEYNNIFMRFDPQINSKEEYEIARSFRNKYDDCQIEQSIYISNNEKKQVIEFGKKEYEKLRKDNDGSKHKGVKNAINWIADTMDNGRRKTLLCVSLLFSIMLFMSFKHYWFDTIIDISTNELMVDITAIIALVAIIVFIVYWGILLSIRIMQDTVNLSRLIKDKEGSK